MPTKQPLFKTELVARGLEVADAPAAIEAVARLLLAENYVKQSYITAVLDRERDYPTGLPTGGVGVAIPHADTEHVLTPGIAVGVLMHPVLFNQMGDPDKKVSVELVFVLAIQNPEEQVQVLQRLMGILGQEQILFAIKEAGSADDAVVVLNHAFEKAGIVSTSAQSR